MKKAILLVCFLFAITFPVAAAYEQTTQTMEIFATDPICC